jgi:hypothetical protein
MGGLKALSLIRAWKKAAGPIFGAKARFYGIYKDPKTSKKVLVLDLQDPIWKQELLFESSKLLELYNLALKEEGIPAHEWPESVSMSPNHSVPLQARHSQSSRHKEGIKR